MHNSNPKLLLETSKGNIEITLQPDQAPNGVRELIRLVEDGLVNNREIKRVAPDFVLQPTYSDFDDPRCEIMIPSECRAYGVENNIVMNKGAVGLGADGAQAGPACFFIVLSDDAQERLDGKFPGIGRVTAGWDTVEAIISSPLVDVPNDDGVVIKCPTPAITILKASMI